MIICIIKKLKKILCIYRVNSKSLSCSIGTEPVTDIFELLQQLIDDQVDMKLEQIMSRIFP